jgi:phosphoglycerate kinase
MKFKRLTDLDLQAASASSSAPTSTCRRTTPATSPTTRASAPRSRHRALPGAGAAVMVTSHLGRPTEGAAQARGLAGADRAPPVRTARPPVPLVQRLGRRRFRSRARRGRAAGELPRQQGREEGRRALARKMAALCDVYVNDAFGTAHRAEATTHGIARSRRSPAPARCWPPNSTRWARRWRNRRGRWSRSSPAPRCRPS